MNLSEQIYLLIIWLGYQVAFTIWDVQNMANEHFDEMSPYELGLTRDPAAIPFLIDFMNDGGANERRLAASAIRKLLPYCRDGCAAALEPLIGCLRGTAPQVRQYALNTLSRMQLSQEALAVVRIVAEQDDKYYNRDAANVILRKYNTRNSRQNQVKHPKEPETLRSRIEACLDMLDTLEDDLRENLAQLWAAEDELTEARRSLERAEQNLILQGVEGKNETERRARMASVLAQEHLAVDQAERQLRVARRERDEHNAALHLVQQRIDALNILVQVRTE